MDTMQKKLPKACPSMADANTFLLIVNAQCAGFPAYPMKLVEHSCTSAIRVADVLTIPSNKRCVETTRSVDMVSIWSGSLCGIGSLTDDEHRPRRWSNT